MPTITKPDNQISVTPRMLSISPYHLYLEQIRGATDAIRVKSRGLNYIPSQFGGIQGQIASLSENVVARMIDFENNT